MTDKERNTSRFELNSATAFIGVAILAIGVMSAYAQIENIATPENAKRLAELSPAGLLAFITILSLCLSAYLIRLLFGKLLNSLDENAAANQQVAKLLAEIRTMIESKR